MERILIVDDETSNLSMVRRILQGHGYELSFAQSGKEALEKVRDFRPDLLILDIMMPGMDGYEVCCRIKENPETQGIMVLLLSGRSSLADRLKGYEHKSDDFLAKPFEAEELLARVSILLRLKSAIDQAYAAEKRKADFLASMSHEIRTPMAGMIGMMDILEMSMLTDDQADCLHSIRTSADALLSLINEILDFSKIEAGKTELYISDFDLLNVLDGLNDILGVTAGKKGLDYACIVEHSVPVNLSGDFGRLRQILLNLGGNAIKFTPSGQVCIRVSLESDEGHDVILAFRVQDSGIGIPQNALPRLFESYTQVGKEIAGQYGGTGLGLSISDKLARLMGGDIHVESKVGIGSAFTARVRLSRQGSVFEGVPPVRGMRILYADHRDINRQAITELCKRWACELTTCDNGPDVLSALNQARERNRPYQAVLLADDLSDTLTQAQNMNPRNGFPATVFAQILPYERQAEYVSDSGMNSTRLFFPIKTGKLLNWLIRIATHHTPLPPVADHPAAIENRHHNLRVLLADDNEISVHVSYSLLSKLGCAVTSVSNGKEALEAFRSEVFDLVFMDSMMPEMDGLEATRQIRMLESRYDTSSVRPKRVPIIVLTGNSLAEEKEKFIQAGSDDYITKPINFKSLEDIVARNTPMMKEH